MKKIVFLSHFDGNLYLFRLPLMKSLLAKGWEVYTITPKGNYSHLFLKNNLKYVEYKLHRNSFNPLKEVRSIWDIKKRLQQINPLILHTFTVKPNIYGTIAGKISKIPIIINTITGLGSFFIENDLKSFLIRRIILTLYKITFKLSDAVIFQNEDDLNFFLERKIVPASKSFLIKGSGIDTSSWTPMDKRKKTRDTVKIITIARLIKHKGILEFIKIAKILKKKYGNKLQFIIIGDFYDGNPYAIKRQLIDKMKQQNIIIHYPWLSHEEVREILQNSDIFVLLSDREGISRSGIEALAVGLPIITYKVPGCKELVEEGVNGYFVKYKDINDIIQKLEILIHNSELREKMGLFSRRKAVMEFDIQKIVSQYISLYESLLNSKIYKIKK